MSKCGGSVPDSGISPRPGLVEEVVRPAHHRQKEVDSEAPKRNPTNPRSETGVNTVAEEEGDDEVPEKPSPGDGARQKRRRGKKSRRVPNGVQYGWAGTRQRGRHPLHSDSSTDPSTAEAIKSSRSDLNSSSSANSGGARMFFAEVSKTSLRNDLQVPSGPKGGICQEVRCAPAVECDPTALKGSDVQQRSNSSCDAFYSPMGSYDGDDVLGQMDAPSEETTLGCTAKLPKRVPSLSGGAEGVMSPFEVLDMALNHPRDLRGMWESPDDELNERGGAFEGLADVRRTAGTRRERVDGVRYLRKFFSSADIDSQIASGEALMELRSLSASASQTAPAPPLESALVRSQSMCLPTLAERFEAKREDFQRALQSWVFSTPSVQQEMGTGLQGVSLAKETNKLQLTRDETGAACINQYVIVRSLGQGSHGRVRVCLNALDGKLYAVKTINRAFVPGKLQQWGAGRNNNRSRREAENGILRELAIMKKLDHPNVVKLHEVIDPKGKENIVLITEFMEKGTLLKRVDGGKSGKILFKRIPEEVVRMQFRSVVAGLDYLHYHGIVHGDIKPDNLLVAANGAVKIGDFTCSRMVTPEHFTSGVYGTPAFHAPEVIAGDQYNPYAADIWAFGVCVYCAVCGELPFTGPGIMSMYNKILACEVTYPEDLTVSNELKDFISKIFVRDAQERITMEDLMYHPFLNWEDVQPLCSLRARTNPPSVIEVSPLEEDDAIDRVSVVSFIRAKLKRKKYKKNDHLFEKGQPVTCVYFILEGSVALVETYSSQRLDEPDSCSCSLVLDMDESFMISQPTQAAKESVLHLKKHEVKALQKRRRDVFLKHVEYHHVVAVRGPGQVVGEMFVPGASQIHECTACAQGNVTVLKLTEADLQEAFKQGSLAKASVDSSRWTPTPTIDGTDSGTGTVGPGAGTSRELADHTSHELGDQSTSSSS